MAFPVVDGTATTNGTTATATPVVNLPAGIGVGNTVIVLVRVAVAGVIGWPAGWTELFDASSDAADDQMAAAWRKADGTEGATITLSSGNGKFAAIAYDISTAEDPTVQAPQLSTVATGTGTTPDPTTCTPTGGAKDYLWLWIGGWENEQTSPPTGTPTNFTDSLGADSGIAGAVTTNCRVASARRSLNAASLDAGSWTISVSDDWTAYLLAVHPSTAQSVSPGSLPAAAGSVAPTRIDQTVSPGALGSSAAAVAPSIPQIVGPASLAAAGAVVAPARMDQALSPGAAAAAAAAVSPGRLDQEARPASLGAAAGSVTPAIHVNVNPAAVSSPAGTAAPARVDQTLAPATVMATATATAPGRIDLSVTGILLSAPAALLAPSIDTGALSVSPPALTGAAAPVALLRVDQGLAPGAVAAAAAVIAPARVDQRVVADLIVSLVSALQPEIASGGVSGGAPPGGSGRVYLAVSLSARAATPAGSASHPTPEH